MPIIEGQALQKVDDSGTRYSRRVSLPTVCERSCIMVALPVAMTPAVTDPFDLLGIFVLVFLLITVCTGAVLASMVKLVAGSLLAMKWKASAGIMVKNTLVEALVMTFAFILSVFALAPFITSGGAPRFLIFIALFGGAAVFHVSIAFIPNLKLLQNVESPSKGSNKTSAKAISTALLFSLITPCFVTLLMLVLVRTGSAW